MNDRRFSHARLAARGLAFAASLAASACNASFFFQGS